MRVIGRQQFDEKDAELVAVLEPRQLGDLGLCHWSGELAIGEEARRHLSDRAVSDPAREFREPAIVEAMNDVRHVPPPALALPA
jgi:hypothetical protein